MIKHLCFKLCLILTLICALVSGVNAKEYIPMHTESELGSLFERVAGYLQENQDLISETLDETEDSVVTEAFVRAWSIAEYEDPSPEQIDNAYEALYNAFLFLGLNLETQESLNDPNTAETLYRAAYELLDQEYFDLLEATGDSQENIDYAEYLRDIAEALVDDPNAFTEEETATWITDLYAELYMASGLKAIAATEKLPTPESLYADEDEVENISGVPNPLKEYETDGPLTEMLGIRMPDLSKDFDCTPEFFGIIGNSVADARYVCGKDRSVLLRLAPFADLDISGIYGAEFYEDLVIYSTETEVDRYQDLFIGWGTLHTHDQSEFSFAVEAEDMTWEEFYPLLKSFIADCRNQTVEAGK